jgi:hypothetical protein
MKRRIEMTRYWKYLAVGFLALAVLVPAASAHPGVYFRGYFGGPFYGPAYYGWYGPAWYGPGYYAPYGALPEPNVGKVKLDTKMKDARVYVDGGYAGTVGELKTFPLRPGSHNIELRDASGQSIFQEKVDVIAGKTTKLTE